MGFQRKKMPPSSPRINRKRFKGSWGNKPLMRIKSRKAKGRRLQNFVRDKILKTFKHLKKEDVQVALMSETGPDIKLSRIAKRLVPLQFECKNQEKMRTVYDFYKQAKRHGSLEPVVCMKQNSREPLIVIGFDYFFELIQ